MPTNIDKYKEPISQTQMVKDFLRSRRKKKQNAFTSKELSKRLGIKTGYISHLLSMLKQKGIIGFKKPFWFWKNG